MSNPSCMSWMSVPAAPGAKPGATGASTALARLLAYPDEQFEAHAEVAQARVAEQTPEAGAQLQRFRAALDPLSRADREELYTRTFDINPACALEIGWHLFGEEYHRGALLVRLRSELRRHGLPELTELPDHLLHVLPLLDRMARDEACTFAACCVLPALDKMLVVFQDGESAYGHLLRAVTLVVQTQYGAAAPGGAA